MSQLSKNNRRRSIGFSNKSSSAGVQAFATPSHMVASRNYDSIEIDCLPIDDIDWFAYKQYALDLAGTKGFRNRLDGTASHKITISSSSTLSIRDKLSFEAYKESYDQKDAQAWLFLTTITRNQPFLISQFQTSKDVPAAWKFLCKKFEEDGGALSATSLLSRIQTLRFQDSNDPTNDLLKNVSSINTYDEALAKIDKIHELTDPQKRQYLVQKLPVFYHQSILAINDSVTWEQFTSQLLAKTKRATNLEKLCNLSGETVSTTKTNSAISENDQAAFIAGKFGAKSSQNWLRKQKAGNTYRHGHSSHPYNHNQAKDTTKSSDNGKGDRVSLKDKGNYQNRGNNGNEKDLSSVVCFYCKKLGHYSTECRKRIKDMAHHAKLTTSLFSNTQQVNNNQPQALVIQQEQSFAVQQYPRPSPPPPATSTSSTATAHVASQSQLPQQSTPNAPYGYKMFAVDAHGRAMLLKIKDYSLIVAGLSASFQLIIDSGCTQHICYIRERFTDFRPYSLQIQVADGNFVEARGIGSVGPLNDVLYVPDIPFNLMSTTQLCSETGCSVLLTGTEAIITDIDLNSALVDGFRSARYSRVGIVQSGLYMADDNFMVAIQDFLSKREHMHSS